MKRATYDEMRAAFARAVAAGRFASVPTNDPPLPSGCRYAWTGCLAATADRCVLCRADAPRKATGSA